MYEYELDSSEEIKSTQKAFQRISDRFNAEVWAGIAEWMDKFEDNVRRDEREKAAQRLIKAQPWTNSNETYLTTEYAVFIVRGGER